MNDEMKQQAVAELISTTYENMGFAILSIAPFSPGVFKAEVIEPNGIKDVYVTVMLHMTECNVNNQNAH